MNQNNKPSWIEEKTGRAVHGEDDAHLVLYQRLIALGQFGVKIDPIIF